MTLITPAFGIIFWQTITLLAVLVILSKFAWKPIIAALKVREEAVASAVEQIATAQTLMQQVAHEREELLSAAQRERERIIGEALDTQQKMIDQACQEARVRKETLLAQAKKEIAEEELRTLEAVKANMGLLAIQMAEKLVMKALRHDQAQWELVERFTAEDSPAV